MIPETEPVFNDRMIPLVRRMAYPVHENNDAVSRIAGEVIRQVALCLSGLKVHHPRFREPECSLPAATDGVLSKKDANLFLCACFLEFRSGKTDVWDNITFFSDEVLGNPDNIWQAILDHSPDEWKDQFYEYNLHPMPEIHNRLYSIANRMLRFYTGDGRHIWNGFEQDPEAVFKRVLLLQIPKSTACLVVGMLKNHGYVQGPFDIVGDIVDSRVLGRMICGDGSGITFQKARKLARMLAPDDPWILDLPLYLIGSTWCGPGPKCRSCLVKTSCVFSLSEALGIHPDPVFREILFGKKTIQRTLRHWQDLPSGNDEPPVSPDT